MGKQIEVFKNVEAMNSVVEDILKGKTPTQISKDRGMGRSEVLNYIDEWKRFVSSENIDFREMASQMLARVNVQYEMLIGEAWDTIKTADDSDKLTDKLNAIKIVAQLEKDRLQVFQVAGLGHDDEMLRDAEKTQRLLEVVMGIVRDVSGKCDKCKFEVGRRLNEASEQSIPIIIDG